VTSESNFNMPWDCARTHPEYPKCDVRYISDADGIEIASLYGTLTRIPCGEDIARLIAAAPDLLAQLKAVRDWMDDPQINMRCPFSVEMASAIREAIAKAELQS